MSVYRTIGPLVAMCDLVHDVETIIFHLLLTANSILKSFLKYKWCPVDAVSSASLIFQKRFPDMVSS